MPCEPLDMAPFCKEDFAQEWMASCSAPPALVSVEIVDRILRSVWNNWKNWFESETEKINQKHKHLSILISECTPLSVSILFRMGMCAHSCQYLINSRILVVQLQFLVLFLFFVERNLRWQVQLLKTRSRMEGYKISVVFLVVGTEQQGKTWPTCPGLEGELYLRENGEWIERLPFPFLVWGLSGPYR